MTDIQPWAKWRRPTEGVSEAFLPLHQHAADVVAVFEALLGQPTISSRLARLAKVSALSEVDHRRLSLLVALHDLGKVNVGFQNKRIQAAPTAGHIKPVVSLIDEDAYGGSIVEKKEIFGEFSNALRAEKLLALFGDDGDTAKALLLATLAHHGRLPEANAVDKWLWAPSPNGYDPFLALAALTDRAFSWFSTNEKLPSAHLAEPRFLHAFAGILMLADWLGSDTRWFPFPGEDGAPASDEDRLGFARTQAAAMLRARHIDATERNERAAKAPRTFRGLFPERKEPRPAQAAILEMDDPPAEGQLVILEAETGSGKTEAAIIHFLRLLRCGAVDGMYFALPTRAAAVQIHNRVSDEVHRILGDVQVGLAVPGYIRSDDMDGIRLPETFEVLWPDDAQDTMRDRGWAVEHPKRYLSGSVMVGTIDQLLLGGLRVRHAHLRSSAMLRQLIVIDEVHASDPYMERLLTGVLDQHRAAGGHALLMSATLGSAMRVRLTQGPRGTAPPPAEAVAFPYPAVHVDIGRAPAMKASTAAPKRVQVELVEAFDDVRAIADQAIAAARQGARVLILQNTVRRAQSLQQVIVDTATTAGLESLLFTCGDVPAPHHARFAADDRKRLDEALEESFGHKKATGDGVIAVATQTAEQSLDIDADLMIADLSPADVLLQRFGRLHRHSRTRPPGFEAPRAIVLAPSVVRLGASLLSSGEVQNAVMGLGTVYSDLLSVVATRLYLEKNPVLVVPDMNRAFVEEATHPKLRETLIRELGGFWQSHKNKVYGSESAMKSLAEADKLRWNESLPVPWPTDADAHITTRLGLDDRRVELPEPEPGPFGGMVKAFNLPGWMAHDLPEEPTVVAAKDGSGGLRIMIGERAFRYDQLGLRPV